MVWMAIRPLPVLNMESLYHVRRKSSGPKGHLIFKPWVAMGCHGLPWVAGIMHREAMARQRELAWILRLQNHYTITAGNIPLLF